MLSYFRPYLPRLLLSLALALFIIAAELSAPYLMKIVIDDYITRNLLSDGLTVLALAYFTVAFLGAAGNYGQNLLLNSIGQRIIHRIRMDVMKRLERMPLSFFDKQSSGMLLTRVTNDIEALSEMYSGVLVELFRYVFVIVGIVSVMVSLSVPLTLLSFSVVPVFVFLTVLYNGKAMRNYRVLRQLIGQINAFFAENIAGMKLVQVYHREREKYGELAGINARYRDSLITETTLQALFNPAAELMNFLAVCLLVWVCAPAVLAFRLEIGVLFAFITYVKFFEPIRHMADRFNTVLSGGVSAERIFELLDADAVGEEPDEGLPLDTVRGEIEFRHVWFAYSGEDWVLRDISFRVEPGRTVAFVGATGSGKTTLIHLLGRHYGIQKGEILLDGVDIRLYRLRDLRRCMGLVMQDVFLFSGTIASNIRLHRPLTDAEVESASVQANADGFIAGLPSGYGEEVKERGCTLSTGQRQLLSFARALAANPAIFILDEATANIDTDTEKAIQKSLARLFRRRTTLVIAHRLSTVRHADLILVLSRGRIVETGRHAELMRKGGVYRKLYVLGTYWNK